jgi:hypothetical protein
MLMDNHSTGKWLSALDKAIIKDPGRILQQPERKLQKMLIMGRIMAISQVRNVGLNLRVASNMLKE